MRILADENIPFSVVKFIKEKGHDVVTLYDLNKREISDVEVVETAEKDDRIILTLDLDFGHMYYLSEQAKINIMVVRPKIIFPENIIKCLNRFFDLKIEPKGLVVVSEKKVRIIR